ncbi:hypothetical protein BOX15_Mlig013378g1 [Macrostomum lignano]|nr:hypothetical protein BOX15_Mlig013864g2 [Macrostomum lignano]PAA82090.1 hypothetical protein BOX15_Mlig013378g1 [Macrostomum lignano]
MRFSLMLLALLVAVAKADVQFAADNDATIDYDFNCMTLTQESRQCLTELLMEGRCNAEQLGTAAKIANCLVSGCGGSASEYQRCIEV